MAVVTITCVGCGTGFEAKSPRAKWCSATCKKRAQRDAKSAAANAKDEAKTDTPAEHGLVKAVRLELEKAEKLDTFNGQLALQLARRVATPDESALMAMSKELRAVMAEALGATPTKPGGAGADSDSSAEGPADDEDEVTLARRQREEARQAAGLA